MWLIRFAKPGGEVQRLLTVIPNNGLKEDKHDINCLT
jgi:hypothetical protein